MNRRKIIILLSALVVVGIAVILVFNPSPESAEKAIKLMNVLFNKSDSLMDAPLPNEAVLVAHGKKRTLSMADLEQLHQILNGEFLSGGSLETHSPKFTKVAALKVAYDGGSFTYPIYRLVDSNVYRVEEYTAGLNSVLFIKDDSSQFEKFLNGE